MRKAQLTNGQVKRQRRLDVRAGRPVIAMATEPAAFRYRRAIRIRHSMSSEMEAEMRTKHLVGCACVVALLSAFTAVKAAAQTSDERTYFTFSAPVEIPGVGLAPGKYLFHLADTNGSRDVVQVLSADGKRV